MQRGFPASQCDQGCGGVDPLLPLPDDPLPLPLEPVPAPLPDDPLPLPLEPVPAPLPEPVELPAPVDPEVPVPVEPEPAVLLPLPVLVEFMSELVPVSPDLWCFFLCFPEVCPDMSVEDDEEPLP